MTETLCVPEGMLVSLSAFVKSRAMPLDVAAGGKAAVRVIEVGERTECDESTLCANGWISCAMARTMAVRLKITPKQMGRLLDHLGIRVKQCELGLF